MTCADERYSYWKYSWHILRYTHDMLRRALDILTSNHDLYWQVLMTDTDRNSWYFLRHSCDLVTGNVTYAERFSWDTLHYILIGSHDMLTDTHDIYWQVLILRRTHAILSGTHYTRHCSLADTYELGQKISGSVTYGKFPRLAKQTSASQEGLHEIWGNQVTIVWGYEGA